MTDKLAPAAIFRGSWIWNANPAPDQYVCFRRNFISSREVQNATLTISIDTDFVAYLNGREVGRGQFSDTVHAKTWNRHPIVTVPRGKMTLAILAYYKGEHFSDYQAGPAGLLACLEAEGTEILTDERWRTAIHPAFRSGRRERVTNQMGFTFSYDARKDVDWKAVSFDDGSWDYARIVQKGGIGHIYPKLTPRPLPQLQIREHVTPGVAAQGSFVIVQRSASPAENMAGSALIFEFPWQAFSNRELETLFSTVPDGATDKVEQYSGPPRNAGTLLQENATPLDLRAPLHGTGGRYLILDLQEEMVGLLEFELEASDGTVLEIASGEHLDDGRVRVSVGGRNFADRYIFREGRKTFQMPFRRIAGRYLQVHISNYERLKIYRFGLRRVEYPTVRAGEFVTADRFSQRLHKVSIRTLELCRHEHFEDCPWREQALYAYDSRLQALFGYYAFGDYQFPKVCFELLGDSVDESGYVALTAPGKSEVNIPIFSFSWIVAIAEHTLFSGGTFLFTRFRSSIEKIISGSLSRRDESTGLYHLPKGPQYWHFYEWTRGLSGCIGRETPAGELHAAYNLYLHEALRGYLNLISAARESAPEIGHLARKLRDSIHRCFWNEAESNYYSKLAPDGSRSGCHELVQDLALCEDIVPPSLAGRVTNSLLANRAIRCSLSSNYHLLKATLRGLPSARKYISSRLQDAWEKMLFRGATSMWETEHGAVDFDFAGSLCHGWASLPIWFHQAVVLGITPTTPGFTTFNIAVYTAGHRQAAGKIPTPHGEILIEWTSTSKGLAIKLSGPDACHPTLAAEEECPVFSARYNGKPIRNSR